MTDQICPIMSRPSQGNSVKLYSSEPLFTSDEEMRKYGWTPIDGKPYSDIIHCLKEKCMAWSSEILYCRESPYCDDADGASCDMEICPEAKKSVHEPGYCKLIEGRS